MIEIVNKLIDICNNKSRGKSNSSSALARKKAFDSINRLRSVHYMFVTILEIPDNK